MFMIGLLFAVSVFFFSYICYDWKDRVVTIIESISAIGIVIFSCATDGLVGSVGLFHLPFGISNIFHCIFATVLFLAFGFQITFLFTKSTENPTEKKLVRNKIYKICGIIIFVFCIIQFVTSIFNFIPYWFPMTWLNEFVMLVAFGVAYLIKSESIGKLNDIE